MKRTNIYIYIIKILVASIISLVILSLFCLIYDYSGAKTFDPLCTVDNTTLPNEYFASMTEGYSWHITDARGFNNDEVIYSPDILVMGDSQLEAKQVMRYRSFAYLLGKYTDMSSYNISVSGHILTRAVNNLDKALAVYSPRYVILDTGSLVPDNSQMLDVIDRKMERLSPKGTSGITFYLKRIPCVKPIFYALENWIEKGTAEEEEVSEQVLEASYSETLRSFLRFISSVCEKNGSRPVIIYHSHGTLEKDGSLVINSDPGDYERFKGICNEFGIGFIDVTGDFIKMYENEHKLPYGFSNTQVNAGHLNNDGHNLIAHRVSEYILRDSEVDR